jgi:hypothetical protein
VTTCKRCRKNFEAEAGRCPHCGEPNPATSGVFQTSMVLIAVAGTETIYRSVEEVPAPLRTKLLKSTNGSNSATILIADQRGRKEIAKAMRNLPGPAQRRLMHSLLGEQAASTALAWLTPGRRMAILIVVALVTLLFIAIAFGHHW